MDNILQRVEWEERYPPSEDEPCQNCYCKVPVKSYSAMPPFNKPEDGQRTWLCVFCAACVNMKSEQARNLCTVANLLLQNLKNSPEIF